MGVGSTISRASQTQKGIFTPVWGKTHPYSIPQKAQPYGALEHHDASYRSRRILGKPIDWRLDKETPEAVW
jgi:hypothetical protein